jgi:hypothetical protein
MKKIIIVLALLAGGFYWYSSRGKAEQITEADVREFYRLQFLPEHVIDPEMACASMAEEYRSRQTTHSPGAGANTTTVNKQQTCEDSRSGAEMLKKIIAASGSQPQASYEIRSIQISADGAIATVSGSSNFRIPGKMKVQTTGTSSLIKRGGKVLSLGGENTIYMARD